MSSQAASPEERGLTASPASSAAASRGDHMLELALPQPPPPQQQPEGDADTLPRCSYCTNPVRAEDGFCQSQVGEYEQWIHHCCNRLKGRVNNIRRGNAEKYELFGQLDAGQRAEFAKKSGNLFGAELACAMEQEVEAIKSKKKSAQFREEGRYCPIEEAKELPRFKTDPVAWSNHLANAPRWKDPYNGQEQIYVAEFKFVGTDTREEQEHHRRTARANPMAVAKGKAKAAPKPRTQKEPANDNKSIPAKQLDKITALATDIEEYLAEHNVLMLVATSSEAKRYVPEGLLEKNDGYVADAKKELDILKVFIETGVAKKGEATVVWQRGRNALKFIKEYGDKLSG
eukprot:1020204-Pyramimonas_sp.AAC.3